jgi:flagellar biosynthesis/type III secretory pathway chaperone
MKIFVGPKPDRQQIQALLRCKQPEMAALVELFRTRLEETKSALIVADDYHRICKLQGRAEVLADFLEAVEKSQEVFDRVK